MRQEALSIAAHCGVEVTATALAGDAGATHAQQRAAVASAGHIVVATPGRLAAAFREGLLTAAMLASRLQARSSARGAPADAHVCPAPAALFFASPRSRPPPCVSLNPSIVLYCTVQTLVLDEADLLLSYGHEGDLQAVAPQARAAGALACACAKLLRRGAQRGEGRD